MSTESNAPPGTRALLRKSWPPLVPEILALLVLFSLLRLVFFAANHGVFAEVSNAKLGLAFLHGIRFDISALFICNLPLILVIFLAGCVAGRLRQGLGWLAAVLFPLLNLPAIVLNLVDIGYFPFTGRRSTLRSFAILGDVRDQALQLIAHYWMLTIPGLGLVALVVWGGVRLRRRLAFLPPRLGWRYGMSMVLSGGLVFLGIRGGWQNKPLGAPHANIFPEPALASLILNTPFNVLYSLKRKRLQMPPQPAPWPEVLRAVSDPPQRPTRSAPRRDNVVILILESCGSEFSRLFSGAAAGPGYTPFLDSLALRGWYFTNCYANGRQSINAVSSILAGIPSLMDDAFVASAYFDIRFDPLPAILRRHGYATAFFHGARKGTMMFDLFARRAGIERYFALEDYPHPADTDGTWGIFDEPYLQYCATNFTKLPTPFLAAVFTLTPHNPYPIPLQYRGRFPTGPLRIHEPIGYADHALARFFETAARQPWYSNTLFVVTADHVAGDVRPQPANELGYFRVPLVLFHAGGELAPHAPGKVVQHADLQPTVLDFLGLPLATANWFGRSVLDESFGGRALNQAGGTYWLVHSDRWLRYRRDGGREVFLPDGSPWTPSDSRQQAEVDSLVREQQMFIQYFNQGLLENRLLAR